jgi:hypothetical protein
MGFGELIKTQELELAFLLADNEEALRQAGEWEHLGQVIADDQTDKWAVLGRLERDGKDSIVRSTTVAEEVPVLRTSMNYAATLLFSRLQVFSSVSEYESAITPTPDNPEPVADRIWHFSLDSSWFAR